MGQEASKISEKGDLGDPKRLPEASQNTKITKLYFQSVLERLRDDFGSQFWSHLGSIFEAKTLLKSMPKSMTFLMRF